MAWRLSKHRFIAMPPALIWEGALGWFQEKHAHPLKNWGRGVTPGNPFPVPFALLLGRLDTWNWGHPQKMEKTGGLGGGLLRVACSGFYVHLKSVFPLIRF